MLNEILCSLLGITGDIIVEGKECFQLSENHELFTISEREQIRKLLPLGYTYLSLSSYIEKNELRWQSCIPNEEVCFKTYTASFCAGLKDVLDCYVREICFLETVITVEGPVPLSIFLHKLQKVIFLYFYYYFPLMPIVDSFCLLSIRYCFPYCYK